MAGVKRKDSAPKLMNGQKGDMEGIAEKKEQQQESHKKVGKSANCVIERRLRGDQIDVFKILNSYENIDRSRT